MCVWKLRASTLFLCVCWWRCLRSAGVLHPPLLPPCSAPGRSRVAPRPAACWCSLAPPTPSAAWRCRSRCAGCVCVSARGQKGHLASLCLQPGTDTSAPAALHHILTHSAHTTHKTHTKTHSWRCLAVRSRTAAARWSGCRPWRCPRATCPRPPSHTTCAGARVCVCTCVYIQLRAAL